VLLDRRLRAPATVAGLGRADDVLARMLAVDGPPVAHGELWIDDVEQEVELARLLVDPALRGQRLGLWGFKSVSWPLSWGSSLCDLLALRWWAGTGRCAGQPGGCCFVCCIWSSSACSAGWCC